MAYQKIISVVPSQTELLYDLGLENEVIGITKFCIHPDKWFRNKTRIGGTKNLHIDQIKSLNPDLIFANKEENVKEQIEELSKYFPVHVTDVNNLQDAVEMISDIGLLTKRKTEAEKIISEINTAFSVLHKNNSQSKAVYLIWKDPYMTVGGDTFINDMLQHCGLQNAFANTKRYPEISLKELSKVDFEVLLLSSEPYPFKQKHIEELQSIFPDKKILLVDGEMFSWYGSRLIKSPPYFKSLQKYLFKV